MRSASFHQANMIAENLNIVRQEVLSKVHNVQTVVANAMSNIPQVDNIQPLPQIQTANAVITNSEMATLISQMTTLTAQVQNMQNMQTTPGGRGRGGRGGRGGQFGHGGRQGGRGGRGGRNPTNNNNTAS